MTYLVVLLPPLLYMAFQLLAAPFKRRKQIKREDPRREISRNEYAAIMRRTGRPLEGYCLPKENENV